MKTKTPKSVMKWGTTSACLCSRWSSPFLPGENCLPHIKTCRPPGDLEQEGDHLNTPCAGRGWASGRSRSPLAPNSRLASHVNPPLAGPSWLLVREGHPSWRGERLAETLITLDLPSWTTRAREARAVIPDSFDQESRGSLMPCHPSQPPTGWTVEETMVPELVWSWERGVGGESAGSQALGSSGLCSCPGTDPWPTPVLTPSTPRTRSTSQGVSTTRRAHLCQTLHQAESSRKTDLFFYFCFIDYGKAFDCVDHNKLWKILKEMGIPDHMTCLLRNLYAGREATVGTGYGTRDWFQIGKGVRQGCILSPCLFNLYAEYIMRNAGLEEAQAGIKIAGKNINNLRYADDTTLMA